MTIPNIATFDHGTCKLKRGMTSKNHWPPVGIKKACWLYATRFVQSLVHQKLLFPVGAGRFDGHQGPVDAC